MSKSGDIVLHPFDCSHFHASPDLHVDPEDLGLGLVVDLETTGTLFQNDQIIELAALPFEFCRKSGSMIRVREPYSSLNELPEEAPPLSRYVKLLTGLDEDSLKGNKIDWDTVNNLRKVSDVIIAHNAKFDRPFLDTKSLVSQSKIWACSMSQIDWMEKGFRTMSLELLSHRHKFFCDTHRALSDAQATLHLITHFDSDRNAPYFKELLENAKTQQVLLEATGSPFETKDLLKSRRYRWNPKKRVWYKRIVESELEDEKSWLLKYVYTSQDENPATAYQLPLKDSFKAD